MKNDGSSIISDEIFILDDSYYTVVSGNTFTNCANITEINFPNVKKVINDFSSCTSLSKVNLPEVEVISNMCSNGCTSLTEMHFGSSLSSFTSTSTGISTLKTVTVDSSNTVYDNRCGGIVETATNKLVFGPQTTSIEDSITSIGDYALAGGRYLGDELSSDKITSIGIYSLLQSPNLKSIYLPNLNSTSAFSFCQCTKLTDVDLESITTIASSCFNSCSKLTNVNIPNVTVIGGNSFASCTELSSVTLTNANTLDYYAFSSCKSLTEINLPSATTIGSYAFGNCTSVKKITMPNIQSIGNGAFYNCTNSSLTAITLPSTLITIGSNAFNAATTCKSITLNSKASIGSKTFNGTALSSLTLNDSAKFAKDSFYPINALQEIVMSGITESDSYPTILSSSTFGTTNYNIYVPDSRYTTSDNLDASGNTIDITLRDGDWFTSEKRGWWNAFSGRTFPISYYGNVKEGDADYTIGKKYAPSGKTLNMTIYYTDGTRATSTATTYYYGTNNYNGGEAIGYSDETTVMEVINNLGISTDKVGGLYCVTTTLSTSVTIEDVLTNYYYKLNAPIAVWLKSKL